LNGYPAWAGVPSKALLAPLAAMLFACYEGKKQGEQQQTKSSLKMATNCPQIAQKTQKRSHAELSEVYLRMHGYILAF